ncbi:hypothetical protein DM791_20130 [Paenarthrobacter nitroguajacolicus]|nr:hypothetical protein [Paenarthrobacter nitroguajacolicus]
MAVAVLGMCNRATAIILLIYHCRMGIGEHRALDQGLLHHEKCEGCRETRPALKTYIDTEDLLVSVERYIQCGAFVWDFSVGLLATHKVTNSLENVVRACSAHSNYHLHKWNYLYPRKKLVPESFCMLDNEEQAHEASIDSYDRVIVEAVEWRDAWRTRKH